MREPDRLRPQPAALTPRPNAVPPAGSRQVLRIADAPAPPASRESDRPESSPRLARGGGWRGLLSTAAVLALLWGGLTGWDPTSWVMGAPAVLAGTALTLLFPPRPRWRLSLPGALHFALWFAVEAVRGAIDVSRRAFAPNMPLAPGFRSHRLTLPPGPARLVFVNAITLLPGTLSAELADDLVVVHMLDTGADLDADLKALEARVRALFALKETDP